MNSAGTQPLSWREERRRDRLAAASAARENETARAQARIIEAEASARLSRENRQARAADQAKARQARHAERLKTRKERTARRTNLTLWLREHVVDLLFVPVIVVPGVLAWTAMAAYGVQLFGRWGVILPAFSEGAMWAFAGATTIRLRRDPDCPVWFLRAGTVLAAGAGAAMNFAHGVTPVHGATRGVAVGAVMALVSVAGVTVHQLVTAGPRRTRAERDAARARRSVARRERAIERAARRRAVAEVDADGNVRLMCQPGTVTMTRRWHGGVCLKEVPMRLLPRPAPVLAADMPAAPPTVPQPARKAPPAVPVTVPEPAAKLVSAPAARAQPARAPQARSKHARGRARRTALTLTGDQSRGMPAEQLAEHVAAMFDEYGPVSLNRVKKDLSVGTEKAQKALEIAGRETRQRTVVQMEARRA